MVLTYEEMKQVLTFDLVSLQLTLSFVMYLQYMQSCIGSESRDSESW
jgi:hypothetical protein